MIFILTNSHNFILIVIISLRAPKLCIHTFKKFITINFIHVQLIDKFLNQLF